MTRRRYKTISKSERIGPEGIKSLEIQRKEDEEWTAGDKTPGESCAGSPSQMGFVASAMQVRAAGAAPIARGELEQLSTSRKCPEPAESVASCFTNR